jgi:protein involved in polysaccharide export with SLBB domain
MMLTMILSNHTAKPHKALQRHPVHIRTLLSVLLSLCVLTCSEARADAMNALAFSGQSSAQKSDDHTQSGLYQARPTHSQRLRYAQGVTADLQPLNSQELERNNAALDQRRAFDAPLQKRLWRPEHRHSSYGDNDNGERDYNNNIASPWPNGTRPSALEALYSQRIIEPLEQFGYDFLRNNQISAIAPPPLGLVNDRYILGVGDALNIALTGQRNAHYQIKLDSNGQIHIPGLAPLNAAGQSLASLKVQISTQFEGDYNQAIYVALSEMRRSSILITGHVRSPGRITLTNQHNVIDALIQAGGVEKTGSLRQIRIIRDGQVTLLDLYNLLLHGTDIMDLNLKDGDRVVVPPIGPTLAIAGDVKRTGIFEILPAMQGMWHESKQRSQYLALSDLLDMGGGLLSPGKIRYLKLDMQLNGDERVSDIDDPFAHVFGDGSILSVVRGVERREGTIEVSGHARVNGMHALSQNKTLHSLINNDRVLGKDIYPLIAIIERWNRQSLSAEYLSFSPLLVLNGKYDDKLQDGDVIHFFSHLQIAAIHTDEAESYRTQAKSLPLEAAYGSAPDREEADMLVSEEIISLLKERSLFVRGAVRRKGHYPVAQGATLENVLAVAGGITLEADKKNIEVTRRASSPDTEHYAELSKKKRRIVNLNHSTARSL